MKFVFSLLLSLTAFSACASQCEVSVKNDIQANDGWLMFHLDDGRDVEIDDQDHVYLQGRPIELSPAQTEAVKQYRSKVNRHLEIVKQYAHENAQFLTDLIDDIAVSLGNPDSFDGLKKDLNNFWQDVTDKYFADGDVILPAGSMDSLSENWQQHVGQAQAIFNQTFLNQVWDALSEKVKQENGINLTSMGEMLLELETRIAERLDSHFSQMDFQETNMCESLNDIVHEEDDLREQIPELHDYRVFTI